MLPLTLNQGHKGVQIMSRRKVKNVYFDIETLQYNTATKKPSDRKVIEYVCTMIIEDGEKLIKINFKSIKEMLDYLLLLGYKRYKLIAHNGGRYDFHFLRKTLIDYYGMETRNKYQRNAENHTFQTTKKELGKEDYMLESRVKAKTNLDLDFKINGIEFVTEDSYPKFQASIATLGKLLFHHGVIGEEGEKLDYDYTRYDLTIDLTDLKARQYANLVYNSLPPHALDYVGNDTNILYLAYKNYNVLFPEFDIKKMSLSQNILQAYNKNQLSDLQLMNTVKIKKEPHKLNYGDYNFFDRNLYDYIHRFYKGGLNVYNDRYVGKIVNDIVHFDLNSSYPNVMANEVLPTYIVDAFQECNLEINKQFYYMIEIERNEFYKLLAKISSVQIRKFLNKYFNNAYDCVYLSTPHLQLLEKMINESINSLHVKSGLKWIARPFGARKILQGFYKRKTDGKKQGLSYGEIYVTKVCLNGIYGIPALRARFNLFEWNGHEYQNEINGFKNRERNIAFASAVTAYAIRNLLDPLTNNVKGIDNGFIYADTDSIFCKRKYFETIKDKTKFDKYELGAWDIEHDCIKKMSVLNHKKYCLLNKNDEIEVHCGGIPLDTFNLNMSFENFVKTQFSDGVEMLVKKHSYTKTGTIAIFNALTTLKQGTKYLNPNDIKSRLCYNLSMVVGNEKYTDTDDKGGVLYIETPYGSCGLNDLNPVVRKANGLPIENIIMKYKVFKKEVEK